MSVTTHTHTDECVPDDENPGVDAPLESGDEAALSISLGAKLIVRFVRMHPGPFALSLIGGVGWAAMIVAASIVLGRVTDEVIEPAFSTGVESSTVWWTVGALVAVGALRGLAVVLRRWFGSVTEARMQRSLRSAVADRLLEMPMGSYRSRPTGQLLATSDVDVTTATQMLMPLPFSLGVIALVVFSLASLWGADPMFAVVAVLLFPALAWLSRYYTTKIHEPAAQVQQKLGRVSAIAHESFDGVMVVKTLAREQQERDRFDLAADDLAQERIGLARMTSIFEPLIILLPNLGMITLLLVGAARIESGGTTIGDLVQAVALFGWLAFPMRIVGFLFQSLPRAVVSIARVDDLLSEPVDPAYAPQEASEFDVVSRHGAHRNRDQDAAASKVASVVAPESTVRRLPDGPLSLEVLDLGFAFGDTTVLDGVSFTARPGEVLALVGSTGSGKSTLVNLLAHLDEPSAGAIRLGGINTSELDAAELRSAISVAYQESYLFARSIVDNVRLGRDMTDEDVERALRRSMADGFVGELPAGSATVVGERGVTLSGGQRQRVALARALARGPRVVIADDAISAVDPVVESRILQTLRGGDTTMVVVAHRLSTITLADRVVHLDEGRIRSVGTHEELLADPEYVALVTAYEDEPFEEEPHAGDQP